MERQPRDYAGSRWVNSQWVDLAKANLPFDHLLIY
jgi:hypothetical protein